MFFLEDHMFRCEIKFISRCNLPATRCILPHVSLKFLKREKKICVIQKNTGLQPLPPRHLTLFFKIWEQKKIARSYGLANREDAEVRRSSFRSIFLISRLCTWEPEHYLSETN